MNSLTEQEKYLKAKTDLLQAKDSFDKLTQEQQYQLINEFVDSEFIVKLAEELRKNWG